MLNSNDVAYEKIVSIPLGKKALLVNIALEWKYFLRVKRASLLHQSISYRGKKFYFIGQ